MKIINYFEKLNLLAKEVFSFKKYKKIEIALRIILAILLSPLLLIFLVCLGMLYLSVIMFNLLEAPVKYVHSILRNEAEFVKTPTQVVVYIFAWPATFFFYVFIALITIEIYFGYVFAAVFGWLYSLGGFRFHYDIATESISKEEAPKAE